MKTFLLPDIPEKSEIKLCNEDFHYLCHVKRLKVGDKLKVKDPSSHCWIAEIQNIGKNSCTIKNIEDLGKDSNHSPEIHLFICLPKGKKMDLILRQAGETGVFMVHPLTSSHSMVKIGSAKDAEQKVQRWRKVLREALQQSGSSIITQVEHPKPFMSLQNYGNIECFYLHQEEREPGLFRKILSQHKSGAIGLIIGPEGGFSYEELEQMDQWGFSPVYLGRNVLRVETAALYAVAMVQSLLGDE
ncbi:MAG: RsmE family RNA methyltransferase [Spirochaetaceae bacterium]|jgi:16S rRNA (uracil1498-N3)-methyltransferase|nr:RsmE family RNA methyltransferase [Spirochaetaceae bacterium]